MTSRSDTCTCTEEFQSRYSSLIQVQYTIFKQVAEEGDTTPTFLTQWFANIIMLEVSSCLEQHLSRLQHNTHLYASRSLAIEYCASYHRRHQPAVSILTHAAAILSLVPASTNLSAGCSYLPHRAIDSQVGKHSLHSRVLKNYSHCGEQS